MALFALSDSVNKLPLDILISRHQFVSHSALARDIRETPAAIVSQLTTVKARPLYVINIHADVYKGGRRCTFVRSRHLWGHRRMCTHNRRSVVCTTVLMIFYIHMNFSFHIIFHPVCISFHLKFGLVYELL